MYRALAFGTTSTGIRLGPCWIRDRPMCRWPTVYIAPTGSKTFCSILTAILRPSGTKCWFERVVSQSRNVRDTSALPRLAKPVAKRLKDAGKPFIRSQTLIWSSGFAYGFLNIDLTSTLSPHTAGNKYRASCSTAFATIRQPEVVVAARQNVILRLIWFLWEAIRVALRALRLLLTFFPLLCLYPTTCLHRRLLRPLWWTLALWAIESSGPVFVKLGQWSSTRRDLFSLEFCNQFSRLQKNVRPHSWRYTTERLSEAFGPHWRQFLVNFDEDLRPIGSGCVAQVYRAYLRADILEGVQRAGTRSSVAVSVKSRLLQIVEQLRGSADKPSSDINSEQLHQGVQISDFANYLNDANTPISDGLVPVAVKVLHPGIHTAFRRDLFIMMTAAKFLEAVVPGIHWLNLSKCVEEFSGVMQRQIDLSYEATNLERFAHNFRNVTSVVFPKPLRPFVTENVLVETFEEGDPMVLFSTNGNYSSSLKAKIADIGIEAVIKMVFTDNFVHGDLHPGNILVQNASQHVATTTNKMRALDILDTVILGVRKPPPIRLVFLDCGITATLGQRDLDNFLAVFTAIVLGNGEEVGDLFLIHSTETKCEDEDGFRKDMAKIVDSFNNAQRFKDMDVSTVINNLFSTLMKHRVKLESNFATVILAMMVVEGLGHSLNPDLDLLQKARPILLAQVKRAFVSS